MGLRSDHSLTGLRALLCAVLLTLPAGFAVAQNAAPPAEKAEPGFLDSAGQWLDRQVSGAKDVVQGFGHEAGVAAKTTADTAKDAADTVTDKLSPASVIRGHEVCRTAPNGAPDCVAAAKAICAAKGFKSGKSVDMTTAETCPAKVYLAGRSGGAECKTETFVSSALCQ